MNKFAMLVAVTSFLAGCYNEDHTASVEDEAVGTAEQAVIKKDAGVPAIDAYAGGNAVACPKNSNLAWTCHNPPDHCCFNAYSNPILGQCTTAACTVHQSACDGPEDCGAGEKCWTYHWQDDPNTTELAIWHWDLKCSATPPGGNLDAVVCHTNADCAGITGTTCKPVHDPSVAWYDLPTPYSVCHI